MYIYTLDCKLLHCLLRKMPIPAQQLEQGYAGEWGGLWEHQHKLVKTSCNKTLNPCALIPNTYLSQRLVRNLYTINKFLWFITSVSYRDKTILQLLLSVKSPVYLGQLLWIIFITGKYSLTFTCSVILLWFFNNLQTLAEVLTTGFKAAEQLQRETHYNKQ